VTTKRIRKLATVAATAALAAQLFAGTTSAAVPNATSSGAALGAIGGDGWAGFTTSYTFQDNNIPKLYLEIDIVNGASVPQIDVTRNGGSAKCGTVNGALIKCQFNSVRRGDTFNVTFAVKPASAGDVTVTGGWSTTGYVVGGNNSHGDAWGIGGRDASGNQITTLVALYNGDGDYAAGWGNGTLSTKVSNNKQLAKLAGLPANKWASVNDNGSNTLYGGFPQVTIVVNGGEPANFQLSITYPKPTSAPQSYVHISGTGDQTDEYFLCARGQTVGCFTWDKKSYTATLNLAHNGSLRRTS
jgi:hypothetical protein